MGENLPEVARFRALANESFEALGECFQRDRLVTAGIGIGIAFVLAGAAGTTATVYLLREAHTAADAFAVLAAFLAYAGLLVAYGALARMAMLWRHGQTASVLQALGFAARRSHLLVGLPLFVLVVAIGIGCGAARLGTAVSTTHSVGAVLAPVLLVVLFALNLVLITALLISHCLTAPCVACLDPSFAIIASRLVGIAREQLGKFCAHQVAAVVVGGPLFLVSLAIFALAFQPAWKAVATGRSRAITELRIERSPAGGAEPGQTGMRQPETGNWLRALREGGAALALAAGAAVMSVAAVLALIVGILPLSYAACVESAIYLGLTGDQLRLVPTEEAEPRAVALGRHPPIVHCWRCDAINRYEAQMCSKCGAALVVCPHCFATNSPDRAECSSCGRPRDQGGG